MAAGDFKWFAQGIYDLGKKLHDLSTADLRLGVVTTATVPEVDTAAPHWDGTGGTTNFAASQVTTGTAYTGPIVLGSEAWTLTASGGVLDFGDITIAQDAGGGFTNGAWGIVYNNTDANKRAIGYLELSSGGTLSNTGGAITITINASGALALAQS